MMLIAIDYEEAFTRDAAFMGAVVTAAANAGHQVVVVSSRRSDAEGVEVIDALAALPVDTIVFTGRRPKLASVREWGFAPALWIADPGRVSFGRTWG